MANAKKYTLCFCKDCEVEFIIRQKALSHIYCPRCGENIYTEKIMDMWIEKPFKQRRFWTKEDDEILLNSIEQGYSRKEIAAELDRTVLGVNKRYARLMREGEVR